jgi:hypothetical protein
LINLTASVKHYKNLAIKLESVNRAKAYSAILSSLKAKTNNVDQEELEFRWESITAENNIHMNHLINTYALTGYG